MALVLTRRASERVVIGDDVRVTVVRSGIRDGVVRLAIEAPRDVRIVREELLGTPPKKKVAK